MFDAIKMEGVDIYDNRYMFVFNEDINNIGATYRSLCQELYLSFGHYPILYTKIRTLTKRKNIRAAVCYLRMLRKYLEMIPEWGACKPWLPKQYPVLDFTETDLTKEPATLELSYNQKRITMKIYEDDQPKSIGEAICVFFKINNRSGTSVLDTDGNLLVKNRTEDASDNHKDMINAEETTSSCNSKLPKKNKRRCVLDLTSEPDEKKYSGQNSCELKELRTISMQYPTTDQSSEIRTTLMNAMQSKTRIWDLSKRNITARECKVIASALATNTSLTVLNLSQNAFGDAGVGVLATALNTNTTLATLNLTKNNITYKGAKAVAKGLEGNTSLLLIGLNYNLDLNYLRVGSTIDLSSKCINDLDTAIIAVMIRRNTNLTLLNLKENNITCQGAAAIAQGLEFNTSLLFIDLNYKLSVNYLCVKTAIDLSSKEINVLDTTIIAEIIMRNTTMTRLDLSNNYLDDESATAIGNVLRINSTLVQLWLGSNKISDVGVQCIAHALRWNTSLEQLVLSKNEIRDIGATTIARSLEENTTLLYLYLADNHIGDKGARAMTVALRRNSSLKSIDLRRNQITQSCYEDIKLQINADTPHFCYFTRI